MLNEKKICVKIYIYKNSLLFDVYSFKHTHIYIYLYLCTNLNFGYFFNITWILTLQWEKQQITFVKSYFNALMQTIFTL